MLNLTLTSPSPLPVTLIRGHHTMLVSTTQPPLPFSTRLPWRGSSWSVQGIAWLRGIAVR